MRETPPRVWGLSDAVLSIPTTERIACSVNSDALRGRDNRSSHSFWSCLLHMWKPPLWPADPRIPLPAHGALSRVRISRPDALRGGDARTGETLRGVFPAERRGNRISSYRCRCLRPCLCRMYRIRGRYLNPAWFVSGCLLSPQMAAFNLRDWLLILRGKSRYSLWDIQAVCGFNVVTLRCSVSSASAVLCAHMYGRFMQCAQSISWLAKWQNHWETFDNWFFKQKSFFFWCCKLDILGFWSYFP